MKITLRQWQLNQAFNFLENLKWTGCPKASVSAMLARKAMRPHVESYQAFVEDIHKAQENHQMLLEIEMKGDNASEEEKATYTELMPAYNKAIQEALLPTLNTEIEIEGNFELISVEDEAFILAANDMRRVDLRVIDFLLDD